MWALLAWALAPLACAPATPAALAVGLGVITVVLLGLAARYLLRPPTLVRVDETGVVFDRRSARWDDVGALELRETLAGRRLEAQGGEGRPPRLLQPFVPVPLSEVVGAVQAARGADLPLLLGPPQRLARFRRPVMGAVVAATVAAGVFIAPIPGAATTGPAAARPVAGRIRGVPPGAGSVLILAVSDDSSPSLDNLFRAAFDDAIDVHWRLPWAARQERADRRGDSDRRLSEASAAAAGAACAGQPVPVDGGGVVVTGFELLVARAGTLEAGDRIVAADGRLVHSIEDLYAAAAPHRPGEQLFIVGRSASGETRTAAVPIRLYEGAPGPSGIGLESDPVQVGHTRAQVDLRGLEGSSAGLASALGLVNALGPQQFLKGGRRIAVTGTIAPDGRVGPIAGLRFKAAAAQRSRVSVMLVPVSQAEYARRYAGRVPVVGVNTLDEAVRALGGPGCVPA